MNKLLDGAVAALGAGMAYAFGIEYAAIIPTILMLMIADHITGIAKSLQNKTPITSYGLRGFCKKLAVYGGALIGIYHMSELASGDFKPLVDIIATMTPFYIGLTEFKSIIENSAKAGFNIPGVKKLDDFLSIKK